MTHKPMKIILLTFDRNRDYNTFEVFTVHFVRDEIRDLRVERQSLERSINAEQAGGGIAETKKA